MTAARKVELLWLMFGALALIGLSAFTSIQPDLALSWRRAIAVSLAFGGIAALPISQYASGKLSAKAMVICVLLAAVFIAGGAIALWA